MLVQKRRLKQWKKWKKPSVGLVYYSQRSCICTHVHDQDFMSAVRRGMEEISHCHIPAAFWNVQLVHIQE